MYQGPRLVSSIRFGDGKTLVEECFKLTADDISFSREYTEELNKSLKERSEPQKRPKNLRPMAKAFLKNIDRVTAYAPHSKEHASAKRIQIFCMFTVFGKHSLWFTFNPQTQNHPIMESVRDRVATFWTFKEKKIQKFSSQEIFFQIFFGFQISSGSGLYHVELIICSR